MITKSSMVYIFYFVSDCILNFHQYKFKKTNSKNFTVIEQRIRNTVTNYKCLSFSYSAKYQQVCYSSQIRPGSVCLFAVRIRA